MNFKPGQKVVCVVDGSQWYQSIDISKLSFWRRVKLIIKGNKVLGPQYNEVVTVGKYPFHAGYIPLIEYASCGQFQDTCFQPLISDEKLEKELQSIFKSKHK